MNSYILYLCQQTITSFYYILSQVEYMVNLEFLFAQMEMFLAKHTDHKAQT